MSVAASTADFVNRFRAWKTKRNRARTPSEIAREDWVTISAVLLTIGLCAPFFLWVLSSCRVFPYSDEWSYVVPMSRPTVSWLFEQNLDHRIPIQKLLHLIILKAADFDFRGLTALSFVTGALTSLLLIGAARLYRGFGSVGDLFIPLCLLSLGTAFSQWGFEFQFLSSAMFSSAFLFFALKRWLTAAFISLFLCAWCGLNGVLISTFASSTLALFIVIRRVQIGAFAWMALASTIVTNLLLWITWVPSGMFRGQPSIGQFLNFSALMIQSPFLMYAALPPFWKFALMAAVDTGGTIAALVALFRARTLRDCAVLATIGAAWFLIASTTYGRAKILDPTVHAADHIGIIPFGYAMQMHYGCFAVLLPIVAWIALSGPAVHRKVSRVIGVLLVALFACAYWANYEWRAAEVVADREINLEARLAIAGTADPRAVADKYITEFSTSSGEGWREAVASAIPTLRDISHYGPK